MEKAVGIGLFALLVVGVAFVQVHYYRERQRAKAECERLEQSIGQMQKQYVDVVKQNQSYRQMNHELKKYQWLVQVMRENMGTVTHGQLLELVLQKKIQEAEHKQITCDVQGTLNGNLRMDEMSLVSLVMNLLDNAIEACVQTETRQIQVVIAEDPAAQMLELKYRTQRTAVRSCMRMKQEWDIRRQKRIAARMGMEHRSSSGSSMKMVVQFGMWMPGIPCRSPADSVWKIKSF